MFSCENLSCERGGLPLFHGLGFCLPPGGFLLLKGANGSGKTSLMRILTGLSEPAEGRVLWRGAPIARNADFKRELTYIGHKNAIKLECTVRENLAFWAALNDTQMMLPSALHFFGLEEKEYMRCHRLSSGWQRRVALARLLLSRGQVWLLDEPTNFLDEEAVALLGSLIETRVTHGGIVVVASHGMKSNSASHMLEIEDFISPREGGGPCETGDDMDPRLRGD